jgi:hypothetical protein
MLGVSGIVPRILYAGQPISIMKSLIHTALNMWDSSSTMLGKLYKSHDRSFKFEHQFE